MIILLYILSGGPVCQWCLCILSEKKKNHISIYVHACEKEVGRDNNTKKKGITNTLINLHREGGNNSVKNKAQEHERCRNKHQEATPPTALQCV